MKTRSYTLYILLLAALSLSAAKVVKPIRVSCIGNSITYGYGLEDPVKDSYPSQLQALLDNWSSKDSKGANVSGFRYEVGRFGKSGATLLRKGHRPYDQQEEFRQMMDFHGDIAIIHLGINDTDPRDWPRYGDEFVRDYGALIDSVRKSNPLCRVLIARLSPISDRHHRYYSGTREWFWKIQKQIELIAKLKDCQLIDFYAPLVHRPDLFPDRLHPNREGYGIIAKTVYQAITGDFGGLQLSPYFADNMVLPRNRKFTICGTSNSGDIITLKIADQTHTDTVGTDGRWKVQVDSLEQASHSTLTVSARTNKSKKTYRSITINNLAVGELWLASGQSNMAFELKYDQNYNQAPFKGDVNGVRILNLRPRWDTNNTTWPADALDSINHLKYFTDSKWEFLNENNAPGFSAVAYYFARMLQDSLQCPVGIVCNAVGGSGTESWIGRESLEENFPEILRNWTDNDFIQDWVRGRAMKNMGWDKPRREFEEGFLQRHPYQPCYLYESSIWPLRHLPINGVIWYQGESNAQNITTHNKLFHNLLRCWRKTWQNHHLPFIYAQLSSLNRPEWPAFRDSQRHFDNQPNTYMVVTSDVGDSTDVHPRLKRPVGERMALRALKQVYRHKGLSDVGPSYAKAYINKKLEIRNEECNEGGSVILRFRRGGKGLTTSDGNEPGTFELAEHEGLFYPATAVIQGDSIIVKCNILNQKGEPVIRKPKLVRYGWQPFTRANLVNNEGLPASTFKANVRTARSEVSD